MTSFTKTGKCSCGAGIYAPNPWFGIHPPPPHYTCGCPRDPASLSGNQSWPPMPDPPSNTWPQGTTSSGRTYIPLSNEAAGVASSGDNFLGKQCIEGEDALEALHKALEEDAEVDCFDMTSEEAEERLFDLENQVEALENQVETLQVVVDDLVHYYAKSNVPVRDKGRRIRKMGPASRKLDLRKSILKD